MKTYVSPGGPEIVESYRGLGNAYREKQEYPRALEYFGKALANKTAQLGSGHKDLGRFYLYVAEVQAPGGLRHYEIVDVRYV